jgi:hypothetical protein
VRPELVPLLLVALLLLSAQPGVESVTTLVGGDTEIAGDSDAIVVLEGNASVPAGETVNASLYVVAGQVSIDGTVRGEVVQFAGEVTAGPAATVTGTYRVFGGERTIAEGAAVAVAQTAAPLTETQSPAEAAGFFLLQALALAAVAFAAGRRVPALLGNVGHAVRSHPVVSGTVGLLAGVTLLALFVFMAFTLVLLPVTVLGLAGGVAVVAYAYVCVGYLVGQQLPVEDAGTATAAGGVLTLAATDLLGFVPVVGGLLALLVVVTATGAVVVTYFGLRRFEPPSLPAVE